MTVCLYQTKMIWSIKTYKDALISKSTVKSMKLRNETSSDKKLTKNYRGDGMKFCTNSRVGTGKFKYDSITEKSYGSTILRWWLILGN